jgi:serine phosphatase RsbU (regulator of sigma subunit)
MDSLLRSAGFEVATYRSATEFLQAAQRRRHGCLVLDIGLPGLSGLDLQRELLSANVRIPIVFVTAYADVPTSVRAMKAGAIEFLTKPFDADALLNAIREAIDRDLDSETDEAYEKELEAAADVQQGLMRLSIPRLGFAAVAGANQPCTEVGGDFYTAITVDGCVFAAIADVAGKGVAAAVMACLLQGMIVEGAQSGLPLTEIARTANEFFSERDLGRYATCVILHVRPDGRSDILNCAHVPPVIVRRGKVHRLRQTNLPLGLIPSAQYESCSVDLSPGDRILLATDGVTEAENSAGVYFGDERLENAVNIGLSPEQILASVREFCTNRALSDDCTLLDVQYLGTERTVQADTGMGDQSAIPTTARSVD